MRTRVSSKAKNLKNPCERGIFSDFHERAIIAADTTRKITRFNTSSPLFT
jgi:hypothetical protein